MTSYNPQTGVPGRSFVDEKFQSNYQKSFLSNSYMEYEKVDGEYALEFCQAWVRVQVLSLAIVCFA